MSFKESFKEQATPNWSEKLAGIRQLALLCCPWGDQTPILRLTLTDFYVFIENSMIITLCAQ